MSLPAFAATARPRLLLVEDDAPVRRSLQLLLESRGYDVRAYRSGSGLDRDGEALRADCLVADMMLADGDALELRDSLTAAGWLGPSVLISGHYSAALEAKALERGYDVVLAKPFSDAVLTGAIARLVSNAPRSAPEKGCATG